MKKLLLISLALLSFLSCKNTQKVNITNLENEVHIDKPVTSSKETTTVEETTKNKDTLIVETSNKETTEIIKPVVIHKHNAPEQNKIDSIKKYKLKRKK